MENNILISLDEYKQLLEIKGRYEELKEQKRYENSIPTTIYKPLSRNAEFNSNIQLCNNEEVN